jgi:hypothetical protein
MVGRQTHRTEDAYLAHPLVDRTQHRVEHNQRGNHDGQDDILQALPGGRLNGAVAHDSVTQPRIQVQPQARHQLLFQDAVDLLACGKLNRQRVDIPAQINHGVIGHEDHHIRFDVDILAESAFTALPPLTLQSLHQDKVHRRQRLGVQVRYALERVRV